MATNFADATDCSTMKYVLKGLLYNLNATDVIDYGATRALTVTIPAFFNKRCIFLSFENIYLLPLLTLNTSKTF